MNRRAVLLLLAAVLWACGDRKPEIGTEVVPEIRRESGLDVLLITVDTLRADALGAYGNSRASTPWMDRLAASGVRFDTARAHNVVTLPAHATILTGLHPQEHGVRDNSGYRLPAELPTLTSILRQQGYRTGAFVSAFPLDSRFGLDAGFDVYEDSFVGASSRPAFLEQERSGAETVALARSWIEADDDRPSFCWVHLYEPHFPYAPPEALRSRFADDPYLGEVAAADAYLAPLLEPVLARGSDGRTLVVLTSDHGEALGEHGEATHGIFGYESTLRVPLVLYQPRLLEPGVVREPVRHVDLLPTVLDLLSLDAPSDLPGRSLLPVLAGQGGEEAPPSYFEALSGQLNRGWAPLYGVIRGDTKYIELPIPELYHLGSDPAERTNLAAGEPDRLAEMREVLAPFRALDSGAARIQEDAETVERLRSLGYLSGDSGEKRVYTAEDDPKRLMELDELLREVGDLYHRGRLAEALERARELVRRRPGMRVALLELAHLERESGNLEAAVEALREAHALHPADSGSLALLAGYLTQAGRPQEAVEVTGPHSLLADPDVDVLLVRALAQARMGRGEEALAELRKARRIDPDSPAVAVHLGTIELMRGRPEAARASFERALTLNPDAVSALVPLGILAAEEGRTAESVEYWRRAVALDPRALPRLLAMGMRLRADGRSAQARPLLELFVASAPPATYGSEIARVRSLLRGPG